MNRASVRAQQPERNRIKQAYKLYREPEGAVSHYAFPESYLTCNIEFLFIENLKAFWKCAN